MKALTKPFKFAVKLRSLVRNTGKSLISSILLVVPAQRQIKLFNPSEASVAEKQRTKKKAAVCHGKSRTLTAVFLEAPLHTIPKGHARTKLSQQGRVRKLQIRRTMTSANIKEAILIVFLSFRQKGFSL